MIKSTKPLLLIILLLKTGISFSQNSKFMDICQGIKADSILMIMHTKSANNSNNYVAYVCYKTNGKFYFKMHQKHQNKIKVNTKVNDAIKVQLQAFYTEKIFNKNDSLKQGEQFYIDDGPLTEIYFKTLQNNWYFNLAKSNSNDVRVVWINKFLSIIKHGY